MPQGCIFLYFLNKTEGAVTLSKSCDAPRALISVTSNFCCDEIEPRKITHSPDSVKLQPKAFPKMLVITGKSIVNSEQEFTLAHKNTYLLCAAHSHSPCDAPSGLVFLYLATLTVIGKLHHVLAGVLRSLEIFCFILNLWGRSLSNNLR